MEEKWNSFKQACSDRKNRIKSWSKEHAGELVTVFGGLCTVAGAIISYAASAKEDKEYIEVKAKIKPDRLNDFLLEDKKETED